MSSIMVYFILVGDIIQSTFLLLVIYKAVCHILHQNSSDPFGHVIGTSVLWHQDAFVLVLVVLGSLDWSRFSASFRCLTRLGWEEFIGWVFRLFIVFLVEDLGQFGKLVCFTQNLHVSAMYLVHLTIYRQLYFILLNTAAFLIPGF